MPLRRSGLMRRQEVRRYSLFYCLILFPHDVADREVQRILLELLNQMDGFDQNVNVKVGDCG